MRYFQNDGQTYGYDETDITQLPFLDVAISAKWTEVTDSWPLVETDVKKWATYQAEAKAALAETSTTVERIVEAVALEKTTLVAADVVTFMQYRADLRAILSEAQPKIIPTALPPRPDYPAGT